MSRRRTYVFSDIQCRRLNQNNNNNNNNYNYNYNYYNHNNNNINNNNGYLDSQFQQPAIEKIPWKSVGLAFLLCFGGLFLLTFGSLIVTGHLDSKFDDRMWPMIIIGALMFIPGVYHTRIALYAYRQYPGFSFNDIPEFD